MQASLRLSLCAALGLSQLACTQPSAQSKFEPLWARNSGGVMVHRPSGIRVLEEAGSFHKKNELLGEWQDYRVFYARTAELGGIQVIFSGVHTPAAHAETCGAVIDRLAGYADRSVWHKERLEPWRTLAPLFAGMETGRAATYNTVLDLDDVDLPMRSEIYILCGTNGEWIIEYRADYSRSIDGSTWISELIAATAPD